MEPYIHNDWWQILAPVLRSKQFEDLFNYFHSEYQEKTIFPPKEKVFMAFNLTAFSATKVVILGQDPYHGRGQAEGLSFSVADKSKLPPSLRNIYQELGDDLGVPKPTTGSLKAWAQQGVLLLNNVLTVRQGVANSHKNIGWEVLSDVAIKALSDKPTPVVFILWGKPAQSKLKLIDQTKNLVIMSAHPSPLSAYRGFFGSKPFSQANAFLIASNQTPINWQLP